MLIVHVHFAVAPENRPAALATLKSESTKVRAMPGNLGYDLWIDPDNAGCISFIHEWTAAEALNAYRASDLFKAVGAELFPKMVGKPVTRVFSATPVGA